MLRCRVHVVFGSIISGFEVIKKVEGLKTDSSSRPYADVRVMDCGQLFTKSANDGEITQTYLKLLWLATTESVGEFESSRSNWEILNQTDSLNRCY